MADDSSFRSYRPADPRWPVQSAPAAGQRPAGNDPLAELARLIGQTDPLVDDDRSNGRGDVPPPTRSASPTLPPLPPMPRPLAPQPRDPYGSPLQFGEEHLDTESPEPQPESFQPAYDPAIYGTPEQPQASGFHPSANFPREPLHRPHGEAAYEEDDEDERPRRGWMKLVAVFAGLAVIGTGGFLGYRAVFSGGPAGPPPMIKANVAPSKIVPEPAADASKQIYDRVGEASQGERVISREEKPVEVRDSSRPATRVAFPGMPDSAASNMAMGAPSAPLGVEPGGPASAEPKKIRTVKISPEGTGSTPAPAPRTTAAPPARVAAAGPAAPVPAAAPSRSETNTAGSGQNNGPLSLNPRVASAEASARSAPPPAPRAAAAPAAPLTRVAAVNPAPEAAGGAYTVQISSQRSESEAQASFRSLQTKFPSVLANRQPIIRRADLGDKGIYFRTMVGPFASLDEAKEFCGSLKSAGGQCVIPR